MDTDCYSYLSFRPAVTTCSSSAASLTDPDLLQSYSSSSSSSSCGSTSAESCLSSDEGSSSTVKEEPPSRPASPLPSVATLLPPTLQTIYQQHPQTIGYLVKDENEQKVRFVFYQVSISSMFFVRLFCTKDFFLVTFWLWTNFHTKTWNTL